MFKLETVYSILENEFTEPMQGTGVWTKSEHARFLNAMELYPQGPWKRIAAIVESRTTRQVQTHAQKYRMKIQRHQRGLKIKTGISIEGKIHPEGSSLPVDTLSVLREQTLPSLTESLDFFLALMEHSAAVEVDNVLKIEVY